MNIYVATSHKNVYHTDTVSALKQAGYTVYDFKNPGPGGPLLSWPEPYTNCTDWTLDNAIDAIQHPESMDVYNADYTALNKADMVVLILPCGVSAHIEAGFARGQNKPVVVYIPEKMPPELMYNMFYMYCDTLDDLLVCVEDIDKKFINWQ